ENNEFIALEVDGIHIQSRLIGKYNGANMAAALAVGQYFKVPLAKIKIALEAYTPQNNRSQIIKYGTNEVILDAYNANPTSMMAALEYFENNDAKNKGVFLGDMLEVGESSEAEHQLIVDYLAKGSFGFYVLVGERFYACKNEDGLFFKTSEEAKLWLKSQELNGFTFLIKGSRSMKMEAIIANK
ncbi:MAG: UDP-N-acetylmuramoyl-tripeptide--D-alanyl-D-alanine ligase, partial [Chitinophagales bacterium]|nr:UDP-N-acetylmuramoyl-tripeptide--D-alanyl-D-alanine ligase [Chitinophagales bacterium]